MKNNKKDIFIAVFTIFVTIIWIASNLYHISVSSTIPEEIKQNITPFDPSIDEKVFEIIEKKKSVNEFEKGVSIDVNQATNSAEPK